MSFKIFLTEGFRHLLITYSSIVAPVKGILGLLLEEKQIRILDCLPNSCHFSERHILYCHSG